MFRQSKVRQAGLILFATTLLLILGPERGWDFAVTHGLAAILVTRAEGGFVSRATPAFERAVKGD